MCDHNTPTLETERLRLRRFTENDLDALFSILSDEAVNTFLPWFPLQTREDARIFLNDHYLRTYQHPAGYRYAVCLKTEDRPIGYIHVSLDDSHDLGYALRQEWWHKGLMTEAGRAVLRQIERDGLRYVTATHDVNNPRSGAVMKQLGMRYRYSYREQWQPKDRLVTFRLYQRNFDGRDERLYRGYWDRYSPHFIEDGIV